MNYKVAPQTVNTSKVGFCIRFICTVFFHGILSLEFGFGFSITGSKTKRPIIIQRGICTKSKPVDISVDFVPLGFATRSVS